jgi:hypothetical protein
MAKNEPSLNAMQILLCDRPHADPEPVLVRLMADFIDHLDVMLSGLPLQELSTFSNAWRPGDDGEDDRLSDMYKTMQASQAKQGFDLVGLNPDDDHKCIYRVQRKVSNRWNHVPCGESPLVTIRFVSPENPGGLDVPLCRRCIGLMIRNLLGYLDC